MKKPKKDLRKLKGRIIEKFGGQGKFAEVLGIAEQTMSRKMTGAAPITTDDIEEWSKPELLDIQPVEYPEFYFKYVEEE